MCQEKSGKLLSEKLKQVRAGRRNMPMHVSVWYTSFTPFHILLECCSLQVRTLSFHLNKKKTEDMEIGVLKHREEKGDGGEE